MHGSQPTHILAQVAASGEPVLKGEVTDAELVAMAPDPEYLALARQIGAASAMVVPLITGGRTFGIMALTCYESKRRFDPGRPGLVGRAGPPGRHRHRQRAAVP